MLASTEGHICFGLLSEDAPGAPLLRMVAAFRRLYPRIRFSVVYGSLPQIQEALIADRLNYAVVDRPNDNDFIEAATYGVRHEVLVATRDYVERRGPFESLAALKSADLIEIAGDSTLSAERLDPMLIVPSRAAALTLALAGAGVACLPDELVAGPRQRGELVALAPADLVSSGRTLQILYRKRTARQLYESLFLEYFLENLPPPEQNGQQQAS